MRRELLELAAQRRQARRRGAGGEKFARMRIERQHGRAAAQVFRGLDQPRKHRLMAAMDAIEIADRQRDGDVGRSGQPAKNPHAQVLETDKRREF